MAQLVELTDISAVIEDIGQEIQQQITRINHRVVEHARAYFEQVRQRMPALTGNAVSAVSLSIEEGTHRIVATILQEDSGISRDAIAGYMPEGILKVSPHTSDHSDFEKAIAISKVGRVVINPSAAQDPWRQAALDLGFTNFHREGINPTHISFDLPPMDSL